MTKSLRWYAVSCVFIVAGIASQIFGDRAYKREMIGERWDTVTDKPVTAKDS
jgi:hypothetical protein